jgi:hypothetical protein
MPTVFAVVLLGATTPLLSVWFPTLLSLLLFLHSVYRVELHLPRWGGGGWLGGVGPNPDNDIK